MALKRNYQSPSTKYLYLKIINVNYAKDRPVTFCLQKFEKDNEDQNYNVPLGQSPQYIVEHTEQDDFFGIDAMNELNNNPVKAAYEWLKENEDMVRDFVDC